jgi:hypothetical protein
MIYSVCVYVCMYLCVCIYTYVCVCVYIYIYINRWRRKRIKTLEAQAAADLGLLGTTQV